MKTLLRSCIALVFFCAVAVSEAAAILSRATTPTNTINAVLGDVSFVKKFGIAPTPVSGERLRIRTHLEYVEALMRAEDVSHLSPTLRERRAALLDKLHEYRLTSAFPTNLDFPQERRPCFIDAAGNICAVGFLIEQTTGRALAERINAAHRYDVLADMHLPELTAWVEASGLTARECAMIQPSYGPPQPDPNFKIIKITPSTTTATGKAYTMEIQVVGLRGYGGAFPPSSYGTQLLIAFNKSAYQINSQWTTSATLANRWDGVCTWTVGTHSNTLVGNHTITLYWLPIVGDGNYASTTFTVSPATTVRDLTLPSTISISPNPVTDALTLALPENELHSVRLTNTLGCAVWTLSEASGATTLDVSGLSAGVYFVEVQSARRRSVQKVVKY